MEGSHRLAVDADVDQLQVALVPPGELRIVGVDPQHDVRQGLFGPVGVDDLLTGVQRSQGGIQLHVDPVQGQLRQPPHSHLLEDLFPVGLG
jgi:hypothetical protein